MASYTTIVETRPAPDPLTELGQADPATFVQAPIMAPHDFATIAEVRAVADTVIVATWEDDIVAQMVMAAITTSRTTLYTVPADRNAIIRDITMVNDTASNKTVDVWLNDFKIESGLLIPANQGYTSPFTGVELVEGDLIEAQASAAGVNLFIWGVLEIAA
jgi:hypothetical protein